MITIPRPPAVDDLAAYTAAWNNVREEVMNDLNARPGDTFKERPADGSWSASELAEHLYLTQFFFARSIPKCTGGKLGYDMADKAARDYDLLFNKVNQSQGVQNPPAVSPGKLWDLETATQKLDQAHGTMLKHLADQTATSLHARGYDHPLYGPLSVLDWFWLLTLHENAHFQSLAAK